jgi:hypothetical protein
MTRITTESHIDNTTQRVIFIDDIPFIIHTPIKVYMAVAYVKDDVGIGLKIQWAYEGSESDSCGSEDFYSSWTTLLDETSPKVAYR